MVAGGFFFLRALVQTLIGWGPAGVLVLAAVDSAGIPIPGGVDALLILLGAANPGIAYIAAMAAVFGSAVGCMILFYMARKGGRLYLDARTNSGRPARFRAWFLRYGMLTVFIPALLPIPLPLKVFVLSAGALGVRPSTFLLVVLVARVPRYLGLAFLGAKLGEHSVDYLKQNVWQLLGLAAALFVVLYIAIRIMDRIRNGGMAEQTS